MASWRSVREAWSSEVWSDHNPWMIAKGSPDPSVIHKNDRRDDERFKDVEDRVRAISIGTCMQM